MKVVKHLENMLESVKAEVKSVGKFLGRTWVIGKNKVNTFQKYFTTNVESSSREINATMSVDDSTANKASSVAERIFSPSSFEEKPPDSEELLARTKEAFGKLTREQQNILAPYLEKLEKDVTLGIGTDSLAVLLEVIENGILAKEGSPESLRLNRFIKMANTPPLINGLFFGGASSILLDVSFRSPWIKFELCEKRYSEGDPHAELFEAALYSGRYDILASFSLFENPDALPEPEQKIVKQVSDQLLLGKDISKPLDNLLQYTLDHLNDKDSSKLLSFALTAIDNDQKFILQVIEDNEMHLLEAIYKNCNGQLQEVDKLVPEKATPAMAKKWVQLALLNQASKHIDELSSLLSPPTMEEDQALQIVDKWIALSMHAPSETERLSELLESTTSSNIENLSSELDELLKDVLIPFYEKAISKEALLTEASESHHGSAVFYNEIMTSIFPMLLAPGNTLNTTMAAFLETFLFGEKTEASDRENPTWLAEEKIRSLLQVVQKSSSFRSICSGIELNADPHSPMHEAARLQLGMPHDAKVSVSDIQLLTLLSVGGLLRQIEAGTCISTSSFIMLGWKNQEAVASALSQLSRRGMLQPIKITEDGVSPLNENVNSLIAIPQASQHLRNLGYSVSVSGENLGLVQCKTGMEPLWEFPNITAACRSIGIPDDAVEREVKNALNRLFPQATKGELQKITPFDLLQELVRGNKSEVNDIASRYEYAFTAFSACEENIVQRMMEAATVQFRGMSGADRVEESGIKQFISGSGAAQNLDRQDQVKLVKAFLKHIRFPFKFDVTSIGKERSGWQVPYLIAESENGGVHFLPLDKGSDAWNLLGKRMEKIVQDVLPSLRPEERNLLIQELKRACEQRAGNPLPSLEHGRLGDRWDFDMQNPFNAQGHGTVWHTQEVNTVSGFQSEIRYQDSVQFFEKFSEFIAMCRSNTSVQKGVKETPFFPLMLHFRPIGGDASHQQSLLPGHPSLNSLFPSEETAPITAEGVQAAFKEQLIVPGNAAYRKYCQENMKDPEELKGSLKWIFKTIIEHSQLPSENLGKVRSELSEAFFETAVENRPPELRKSFEKILSESGVPEKDREELLLEFDWKMTQHFFPKGKTFFFAETNYNCPDGTRAMLALAYDLNSGKPRLWAVSEEGRLNANFSRQITKGLFSTR